MMRFRRLCELGAYDINSTWPDLVTPITPATIERVMLLLASLGAPSAGKGHGPVWPEVERILAPITGVHVAPNSLNKAWSLAENDERKAVFAAITAMHEREQKSSDTAITASPPSDVVIDGTHATRSLPR